METTQNPIAELVKNNAEIISEAIIAGYKVAANQRTGALKLENWKTTAGVTNHTVINISNDKADFKSGETNITVDVASLKGQSFEEIENNITQIAEKEENDRKEFAAWRAAQAKAEKAETKETAKADNKKADSKKAEATA